jgi:hypothetical protein
MQRFLIDSYKQDGKRAIPQLQLPFIKVWFADGRSDVLIDRSLEFMSAVAMPALDFSALLKDIPRGAWVALSEDAKRVLSYGSDINKVLQDAKDEGEDKPTIMRVPETSTSLML